MYELLMVYIYKVYIIKLKRNDEFIVTFRDIHI